MTLLTFDLKYCPACHGERPHSKRGKCQSCWTRRTRPIRRRQRQRAEHEAFRFLVMDRDGYRCQRCGTDQHLEVQHRIPRGAGGTSLEHVAFGVANGVTVCRGCHLFVEQWREEAMDQGWLITRFGDVDPASMPILTVNGWELLAGDGTRRGVEP